ncbi:MAG: endonuclease/exonuclease/phosphatase family protein [Acidimicrobiales bacterium]
MASCYVPNGRALDHEHYQYKLRWLDRLRADLAGQCSPTDKVVVCGDFNIAPEDRDVYDPASSWTRPTRATPSGTSPPLVDWGLVDVFP